MENRYRLQLTRVHKHRSTHPSGGESEGVTGCDPNWCTVPCEASSLHMLKKKHPDSITWLIHLAPFFSFFNALTQYFSTLFLFFSALAIVSRFLSAAVTHSSLMSRGGDRPPSGSLRRCRRALRQTGGLLGLERKWAGVMAGASSCEIAAVHSCVPVLCNPSLNYHGLSIERKMAREI